MVLESMAGEIAKFRHIAEAYLSEHQETANFLSGFGKKRICGCSNCKIAREVLAKSGIEPENLPPKKLERRVKAHDKKLVNGAQKLKSKIANEKKDA